MKNANAGPPPYPVKALLFDVFGTVVDWRTTITSALDVFGRWRTIERDWAAVADDWRACYQPALEEVRSGRRAYVELDVLHREGLIATLARHSVTEATDGDLDRLTNAWHRLRPWPDSVEGFARLASMATLVSLSNADQAMSADIAEYAGIRWDVILGAEPPRTYKPRPEVYLTAAGTLGFRPSEIMMVAAHNRDLEAAAQLGFRTALVIRPTEHGPGQVTDLEPTGPWDLVCGDLNELADALGAQPFGAQPLGAQGVDRPGLGAARLSRVRLITLVLVVAVAAVLAFDTGYRSGAGRGGSDADTPAVQSGEPSGRQPAPRSAGTNRSDDAPTG